MKKRMLGLVTIIGKIAFLSYVVYILVSQQPLLDAKREELDSLKVELEEAKSIEIQLRSNLERVNTQSYIEQAARDKLGYLKPNERVFIDIRK